MELFSELNKQGNKTTPKVRKSHLDAIQKVLEASDVRYSREHSPWTNVLELTAYSEKVSPNTVWYVTDARPVHMSDT